jgi:hypothetical protein
MRGFVGKTCALAMLVLFHTATDAIAQGSLKLSVTGTAANAGTFTGTVVVTRFETRGNQIVAIGFISGAVTQRNQTLGTALIGEVAVPVTVRAGGITPVSAPAAQMPQLRRVALSSRDSNPRMTLVQAEACPVVDIVLGPFAVNVLGVDVAIAPVDVQLVGQPGTPLGDLVCQVNALLGNVAGLVGVVNSILGLLTGLLGGLGGVIPGA